MIAFIQIIFQPKVISKYYLFLKDLVILQTIDIIVAVLTISAEREGVIDMTTPYQDLGLLILMAKHSETVDPLSFLAPWTWQLWVSVGAAFLLAGIVTTCIRYFSHLVNLNVVGHST